MVHIHTPYSLTSVASWSTAFSNTAFPGPSGRYLVAPFWDNINIAGSDRGAISYETFESGYFLEQVNIFLQKGRSTSFEGTWMLVAYYNAVFPYSGTGEVHVNPLHVYMLNRVFFFLFRTLSKPS